MVKVCIDLPSSVEQMDQLNLTPGGELTIDSGAVTITHSVHTIDTEADAVTDNLATINGGSAGDVLLLSRASAARAVVLQHDVGNIRTPCGTDHELTANGFVMLKHDGSNWQLQSGNGSGYVVNKLACLAVATSNVTLADEQVIDGVFCGDTARVFLAGQTDKKENGPWDVVAAAASDPGAWTRPIDFQDGFSVSGHIFCIEQGTQNTDTVWLISNHYGEDIVGTDDLDPVQLNGAGVDFNINSLTAESSNSDSDLIAIYDASAGAMRKQTRGEFLTGVSGGSGVPTTRVITAGIGLSGGGDLSDDRTIDLSIDELTAESTANDADTIAIYDASASAHRKQTRAQFLAGLGVPTARTITAGVGLTGGGDLGADRTIDLDITGLTAESTPGNSDLIAIYDASAGAHRKQTRSEFLNGITGGFVPTSTQVIAGVGLSGGGTLSSNVTLNLNFSELTAETDIANGDLFAFYDDSASAHKKITYGNLIDGVILADGSNHFDESAQFVFDIPGGGLAEAANIAAPQITRNDYLDSGFYFGNTRNCGISIDGIDTFRFDVGVCGPQIPMVCEDDVLIRGIAKLSSIRLTSQSADPYPHPVDGEGYLWLSDGTDSGDEGDLMCKIRVGVTTKTITLVDYSSF
ncbi:hypothetical protein [Gimesia fumaroli]|uniref:Depolymerase 2 capsule K5-specific C-terminal domain-containing protein n=1 Tax=Gimesia fumaroli TaxID=2527976 RepID=A0A518ICU3_9PLAN|nr:hypothetical protein [Gimesia fumaroli]QDV50860.1 hypothetical protein Enr17x_29050 [Gimesia fumaroli]